MFNLDLFNKEQAQKKEASKEHYKKMLGYIAITFGVLMVISLLMAAIGSPIIIQFVLGTLLLVVGSAVALWSSACLVYVFCAAFKESVSAGFILILLTFITCGIYYIYYAYTKSSFLVATIAVFGDFFAMSCIAAAIYAFSGGTMTMTPFGNLIEI